MTRKADAGKSDAGKLGEASTPKASTTTALDAPISVSAKGVLRVAIVGIFLLLLLAALYFMQDLLVPLILAFLFAILLSPIVRGLKRLGIAEGISAVIIVLVMLGLTISGGWLLSGPVAQWINDAPRIANEVGQKMAGLRGWFGMFEQMSSQVEQIAGAGQDAAVQRVIVQEPGLLRSAATGVPQVVAKIGLTLVLLLFLLASGDLFREKLVKVLPTLSDKKRAVHISRDIEREVSRYLLTITGINIATGAAVGTGMWLIGMPNPLLWGVAAALLTYIPYLGALVGISLVAAVAVVSFDSLGHALLAPAIYFGIAVLEGQFLTPMIVGRRLEMNAVAILVSVAFWGWLWGFIGALIAVPMLVIVKVISDYIEGMEPVGQFLAARETAPTEDDVETPKAIKA